MDLIDICVIILKFSSREDWLKFSMINKVFLSAFRLLNSPPGQKKFRKILTSNHYLDSFKHILRDYQIDIHYQSNYYFRIASDVCLEYLLISYPETIEKDRKLYSFLISEKIETIVEFVERKIIRPNIHDDLLMRNCCSLAKIDCIKKLLNIEDVKFDEKYFLEGNKLLSLTNIDTALNTIPLTDTLLSRYFRRIINYGNRDLMGLFINHPKIRYFISKKEVITKIIEFDEKYKNDCYWGVYTRLNYKEFSNKKGTFSYKMLLDESESYYNIKTVLKYYRTELALLEKMMNKYNFSKNARIKIFLSNEQIDIMERLRILNLSLEDFNFRCPKFFYTHIRSTKIPIHNEIIKYMIRIFPNFYYNDPRYLRYCANEEIKNYLISLDRHDILEIIKEL